MIFFLRVLVLLGILTLPALAQDTAPKPTEHFTDQVGVVTPEQAQDFNHQLADYERQTSNQFLVAILSGYPDGADYQQYSINSMHAWGVGLKGKDNGVVLFIYPTQHKMFLATGRGLEGAIPDATCNEILTTILRPHLHDKDYEGGLTATIAAVERAANGEYKGTGRTVAEMTADSSTITPQMLFGIILLVVVIVMIIVFLGAWLSPFDTSSDSDYSGGGYSGRSSSSRSSYSSPSSSYTPSSYSSDSSSSSSSNDSFASGGGDTGGGGSGGDF